MTPAEARRALRELSSYDPKRLRTARVGRPRSDDGRDGWVVYGVGPDFAPDAFVFRTESGEVDFEEGTAR